MEIKLHKKHITYKIIIVSALCILVMSSCFKDRLNLDKINGISNPNIAAALVRGDIKMSDLVAASGANWVENPDGLLSIIYRGQSISGSNTMLDFPNQLLDTNITYNFPSGIAIGDSSFTRYPLIENFAVANNENLDSIYIQSGAITFDITSAFNQAADVEIIIPGMTKYGVTFVQRIHLPNTGLPTTITKTIPIYDYVIKFDKTLGVNKIEDLVKVIVKKGANPNKSPYSLRFKQTTIGIKSSQSFGDLGQFTVNVPDSQIVIDMFKKLKVSGVTISDPQLRFNFENSFGTPMDMVFTSLYGSKNGVKKYIVADSMLNVHLNYPNFSQMGSSVSTDYNINSANSNIVDVIASDPQMLVFGGHLRSNPSGTSSSNDFVLASSKVKITAELEFPFYGTAMDITLQDTANVDYSVLYNWNEITSVDFNINTMNYFPADATLQAYLADENGTIYDSLFVGENNVLAAAAPGPAPDYRVKTPAHQVSTVSVSADKFENLKKTKKMIFSVRMSTYKNGSRIVKIYSDYKVSFDISGKGIVNLKY